LKGDWKIHEEGKSFLIKKWDVEFEHGRNKLDGRSGGLAQGYL
jgi:hypothetical protein